MTTLRRFRATDLLRVNNVNLDHLTETFNMPFYHYYLVEWPLLCVVAQAPSSKVAGYMINKVEGEGDQYHGHVSAVTIAPSYRRLGLATQLMIDLQNSCEKVYNTYFVDLYVRALNYTAVQLYKDLGYIIYRRIINYYSDGEDGYDMRLALARDPEKKSEIPAEKPQDASSLDFAT